MNSTLSQLQQAIANLLLADSVFKGSFSANKHSIPVLTEKVGDIGQALNIEIAKIGIAVVVLTPDLKLNKPDQNDRTANVSVVLQVSETVLFNQSSAGTKIKCSDLTCRVIELLQAQPHGVGPYSSTGVQQQIDPKLQWLKLQDCVRKERGGYTANGRDFPKVFTYLLTFKTMLVINTLLQ